MRLIYICDNCEKYIDEIEIRDWDETSLGFDALTHEEKDELLHIDWNRQVGTVRAICDVCWQENEFSGTLLSPVDHFGETTLH
jgi:hypothetical protein